LVAKPHTFIDGTPAEAAEVNADFDAIYGDVNNNRVHKDGSVVMTGQLLLPNANQTDANHAASLGKVNSLIGAPAIPGFIGMWGGGAAPAGWLLCDGAAVSRSTYASLFAAIGTTHGAGNGSTTFNVPDLRSRYPMGAGAGPGLTARTAGQKFGIENSSQDFNNTFQAQLVVSGALGSAGYHLHNIIPPTTVVLFVIKA
jgi:hypothetical protein